MDKLFYTNERNVQIVLAVLKAYGIKKVVASPGTTNICFVGSIQNDPFFEVYSSVDERSAAYIACGLAAESGEPVVLSCTGATASRNYYPGLTEAFYRKLPVLAITSHQGTDHIGHLIAQNIDRRQLPNDLVKISVDIPYIHDERDERYASIETNRAVHELFRHGGGPAHINLHTRYSTNFTVKELPPCQILKFHDNDENLPELPKGNIAIVVGSHRTFSEKENEAINGFCSKYGAVVFCDHSSGYYGRYRVQPAILFSQHKYSIKQNNFSLLIHIGEVSGDYTLGSINANEVWRVNPDGEIRNTYNKLTHVFEMEEVSFFKAYSSKVDYLDNTTLVDIFNNEIKKVRDSMPELELSNVWVAQQTAAFLPSNSRIHLGILNTLRTWNLFEFPNTVESACNVGGFGIDGAMSTLVGASLYDSKRIYYVVLGDLAFFYDLNVVGNRHVGNNIRVLLINNGRGAEFRMYSHKCATFGEDADLFMAAAGHYGNKSHSLVCHYATDLGYEYLCSSTKEEFLKVRPRFLTPEITEKPMILEVFTDFEKESDMLKVSSNAIIDKATVNRSRAVNIVKGVVGQKGLDTIKNILGK